MDTKIPLFIIGILIAGYAVLVMPPMVEDVSCVQSEVTDDGPRCVERITTEEQNQFRLPTAMAGGVVALVGGVLYLGD